MPTVEELKALAIEEIDKRKEEIIGHAKHILNNPEVGFTEFKTSKYVSEIFSKLGIEHDANLALTGLKGNIDCGGGDGPNVSVIGELDSLRVFEHPIHDLTTGAAHACGHHCQIGSMIGSMIGLIVPEVKNNLSGSIIPIAVPAEEFIDVEQRMLLREEGKIEFMGGKQEFIKLGVFDDVDMAMMCHTSATDTTFGVGGTSNAHIVKYVEFTGQAAHAGGSPHMGINALNAAMIALTGINANRETFLDTDTVRVHGILTRGGQAVSSIPSQVTLEWRVRSGTKEAVVANSAKVDRCFQAGAMAVGAKVSITNIPGYMPRLDNTQLQELFLQNAGNLTTKDDIDIIDNSHNGGGSTDMGDLSQIMPTLHPYAGGGDGVGHSETYLIHDYEKAVIQPAKAMACTVIDLLSNNAAKAKEIKEKHDYNMTASEYLNFQRSVAEVIEYTSEG